MTPRIPPSSSRGLRSEQVLQVTPLFEALLRELHDRHTDAHRRQQESMYIAQRQLDHAEGCVPIFQGVSRFTLRITSALSFGEIKELAAEYFGLRPDEFSIVVRRRGGEEEERGEEEGARRRGARVRR